MDTLGIRHARAAILTAILLLLAAGRAGASPRSWQPLLIRGAQIPQLIGQRNNRFEVLAVRGVKLEPIPFQIDEVANDGTYALPDGPDPTLDETPGVLDSADEIAMMMPDLGGRAPRGAAIPPGAAEVQVIDPLGGPDRYVYIAAVDRPALNPKSYINYDPATGAIETDSYRLGFTNDIADDFTLQNHKGQHLPNMIDRFKVRMRARVLGLFHISLTENDVRNRVLAWKAGPIRVIKRVSHSVDLFPGISSSEALSDDFFYRDYFENPFTVDFPALPGALFGDIQVRVDFDFTDLSGYQLLWSGMRTSPIKIGDVNAESALAGAHTAAISWIAFRGHGRTTVQTLAPVADLNNIQRRVYFRDETGPPETAAASQPPSRGVGYVMTGWESMARGAHSLDSLLITAPGNYDPEVMFRGLHSPPVVRAMMGPELSAAPHARRAGAGARRASRRSDT
ncbi:MAG: hypothetical protein ACYDC3_06060 [Candidatus Binataceae bacterium]